MSNFPAGIDTIVVEGKYSQPSGLPTKGFLEWACSSALKHIDSNSIVVDIPYLVELRGDGSFSVELPICQEDLEPSQFVYRITEMFEGQDPHSWLVTLDASLGSKVSLVSLAESGLPTVGVSYPTIGEVTSIASDLDHAIYEEIERVDSNAAFLQNQINNAVNVNDIGVTVPTLINGKIPSSQLPAQPLGNYFQCSSEAEMLALPAARGDFALRSDVSTTFVLSAQDPTVLANWLELPSGAAVQSVNGQTGTVTLTNTDVGAASAIHTHTTLSDVGSATIQHAAITYIDNSSYIKVGGTANRYTELDNSGVRMTDSQNVEWIRFDHSGRVLWLNNAMLMMTPQGQAAPTNLFYLPQINKSTASNWTTNSKVEYRDPRSNTPGVTTNAAVSYDEASSKFTDVYYGISTVGVDAGSNNIKTVAMEVFKQSWRARVSTTGAASGYGSVELTAAGTNQASLVLDGATLHTNKPVVLDGAELTVKTADAIVGDLTATGQRKYVTRMKNTVTSDRYERRAYIYQASDSGTADVLVKNDVEVARYQLTSAGLLTVSTPTKQNREVMIKDDLGWTNIPSSVVTSGFRYCVQGGLVYIHVDFSTTGFSIPSGVYYKLATGGIAAAYRPNDIIRTGCYTGGHPATLSLDTNGDIYVTQQTGTARSSISGFIIYPMTL